MWDLRIGMSCIYEVILYCVDSVVSLKHVPCNKEASNLSTSPGMGDADGVNDASELI